MVGGPTNLRMRLHLGLEVPEVLSSTSQRLGTESLNQSPLGSEPFKQPLEAKGSSTLTNALANAQADQIRLNKPTRLQQTGQTRLNRPTRQEHAVPSKSNQTKQPNQTEQTVPNKSNQTDQPDCNRQVKSD